MITQLARRFWPLLPLGLLLGGCITSKEISIYAVDIESETAVAQPPIYVTENPEAGRVEVSASISVNRAGTVQVPNHEVIQTFEQF